MASKPITKSFQDMPPQGGYPTINTKRGVSPRGPPGWFIWSAVFFATAYGFYQIGRTNEEKRLLLKERRESRMAILPYLQAEQDKHRRVKISEALKKEMEVMSDVPGWKIGQSVYSKGFGDTANAQTL